MIALMNHVIFGINAALFLLLSFIVGYIIRKTKDSKVYGSYAKHMLHGAMPVYGQVAAVVLFVQFWLLSLMIWATFSANSSPENYPKVILVQDHPVAFNVIAGIIMLCNVICIAIPIGGFPLYKYGSKSIGFAIGAVLVTIASVLLVLLSVALVLSILVAIIAIVFGTIILMAMLINLL